MSAVCPSPLRLGMVSASAMSAAASLLDVAIRALVQSGAPRRTVAATAAAMTSVLLADARGGTGRGGAAAPPTAAQQRRTKRKQKAAKERAVLVPGLPSSGDGGDQGPGLGEGLTAEPTSAVAADGTPQLQCTKCNQDFPSRNALYRHLRQSGHAEFSALRSLDDADSASGVLTPPAANLMLLPSPPPPPDLERQLPPPPPRQQVTPLRLGQGGSPARSSAVTTALRVLDVPAHHGPAIHEKRRKGPYR